MFLSIVVPVYNSEKYLSQCLDSLLDQSLPTEEYEIVCINDGSSDNSLSILNEYCQHNPNVRVKTMPNGGVSCARNMGLSLAKGDYIWFIDSDDFILRGILPEIQKILAEEDSDILFFGAYTFHDCLSQKEEQAYIRQTAQPKTYANHIYVTHNIFKAQFLKEKQITFQEDLRYSEDSLFSMACLIENPKILRVSRAYYWMRYHRGSSTSQRSKQTTEGKIFAWTRAAEQFYKLYQSCTGSLKEQLANLVVSNLSNATNQIAELPRREGKDCLERLHTAGLYPFKRPPECSLTRSYNTNRTDWIGRYYDSLILNSFTRIGYEKMRLWHWIYRTCRRKEK